jgi:hypothetical protein
MGSWWEGIKAEKVVWAVNSGSLYELKDKAGFVYEADKDFEGGEASAYGEHQKWFLPNCEVYHTERYGNNADIHYLVPIENTKDGSYTLVMKFSEVFFQFPGDKMFDIYVAGIPIIKDFDILNFIGAKLIPLDLFLEL